MGSAVGVSTGIASACMSDQAVFSSARRIARPGQSATTRARSPKIVLYASVGPELTQYDVDVDAATLVKQRAVTLPANVHYAWPHASGGYLYVASSNSASGMGPAGDKHHVTAFRID